MFSLAYKCHNLDLSGGGNADDEKVSPRSAARRSSRVTHGPAVPAVRLTSLYKAKSDVLMIQCGGPVVRSLLHALHPTLCLWRQ